MVDLVGAGALTVASGALGWVGNVVLQAIRSRGDVVGANRDADLKLEAHRDALTFQLLEAARLELSSLREEVSRLRPLEVHILHFEQALNHIELMLFATPDKKDEVERNARAFLNRMRRRQTAEGTIRNEIQRVDSQINLAGGEDKT